LPETLGDVISIFSVWPVDVWPLFGLTAYADVDSTMAAAPRVVASFVIGFSSP